MDISKFEIEKIIKIRKKDSFCNHFFAIIKHDLRLTGMISENEIKIWKYGFWLGFFYPIFIFRLDSNNELITIKSKLNSVGKLIYISFFILITLLFFNHDFKKFNQLLFMLIFYLISISFFALLSLKLYSYEKKEQLKSILDTLKVIKEKKKLDT